MEQLSANEILYVAGFVVLLVITWSIPLIAYFFDRREKPFTNVEQAKAYYFLALLCCALWPLVILIGVIGALVGIIDWVFGKIVKVVLAKIIAN